LVALVVFGPAVAAERSQPVDCLPDRVVVFEPVAPNPAALFGAAFAPGIVLGPPGDSEAFAGSSSVLTLGFTGSVLLGFDDIVIENRPGPDFLVFENPFFRFPVPASANDDYRIFAEPGRVEVSADGLHWETFPYDPAALQDASELPAGGDVDPTLYAALTGLAGLTPTFTGNWTVANDPATFDRLGTGGISGAGGDAFDLETVGLTEARFVRVSDADTQIGFPGTGEGFDLDAIVVLNGRPVAPTEVDTDGDRLSDLEEIRVYGSNPVLPDSDGDGIDDGREIAGCRNPAGGETDPFLIRESRLWVSGSTCTELRWTFMGTGRIHDLIRGELNSLSGTGGVTDLGTVTCLADDAASLRWSCDPDQPPQDQGFFYLVRIDPDSDYGRSSQLKARIATGGCP
jgi:hypothetical protein